MQWDVWNTDELEEIYEELILSDEEEEGDQYFDVPIVYRPYNPLKKTFHIYITTKTNP